MNSLGQIDPSVISSYDSYPDVSKQFGNAVTIGNMLDQRALHQQQIQSGQFQLNQNQAIQQASAQALSSDGSFDDNKFAQGIVQAGGALTPEIQDQIAKHSAAQLDLVTKRAGLYKEGYGAIANLVSAVPDNPTQDQLQTLHDHVVSMAKAGFIPESEVDELNQVNLNDPSSRAGYKNYLSGLAIDRQQQIDNELKLIAVQGKQSELQALQARADALPPTVTYNGQEPISNQPLKDMAHNWKNYADLSGLRSSVEKAEGLVQDAAKENSKNNTTLAASSMRGSLINEGRYSQQIESIMKDNDANIASGRGPLGAAATGNLRINRMLPQLIANRDNGTPITYQMLGGTQGDIAGLYALAAPLQESMKAQDWSTLQSKLANVYQKVTGNITDAISPDVRDKLIDVLSGFKDVNDKYVQNGIESARAQVEPRIQQLSPDAQDAYRKSFSDWASLKYQQLGAGSGNPASGNTQVAEPKSEAEYKALPSGTKYKHPDDPPGTIRTKK